ncbi:glycosyltransferase [Comamonas sp. 26]|uniref:glycosyltransferase family 2 protein n=1 Tax=Comamonas sp. 26 TaxID=2035201 RepID=UPI000C18CB8F|nr:glycosyltransferase [Comamonas sp. 26]PIG09757.1 GT2 family glycosyltransferase [Comamonas sp. 26]
MKVAALIATRPRVKCLLSTSLPSILRQSQPPDVVVLVPDARPLTDDEVLHCRAALNDIPLHHLPDVQGAGLAAAWNSGLSAISHLKLADYVALLDDDDEWDSIHLEACQSAARQQELNADVVISGLRVIREGIELPRQPLNAVRVDDFLVGNPGWQGSNTFAKLELLQRVGGFTSGLRSANDRDLAIRVLDQANVRFAFTKQMTATWHLGKQPDAISTYGSEDKRLGLRQFHQMYKHRMTDSQLRCAVNRAIELFGINPEA